MEKKSKLSAEKVQAIYGGDDRLYIEKGKNLEGKDGFFIMFAPNEVFAFTTDKSQAISICQDYKAKRPILESLRQHPIHIYHRPRKRSPLSIEENFD